MDMPNGSACPLGREHSADIRGLAGRLVKVEQVTDELIRCVPEIKQSAVNTAASVAEIKETLRASSEQGWDYRKAVLTAVVSLVIAVIGYLGVVYKAAPAAEASIKAAVAVGVAQGVAVAAKQ